MSKGDILVVVHDDNKDAILAVVTDANPVIDDVGPLCQFAFTNVEVDLEKNSALSGLQDVLDELGEDDYAYAVVVDRLNTLDIYGSPMNFGLSKVMTVPGYTIAIH
jgi:hypothetical protein